MIIAIIALSAALLVAVIVAGVGWHRYFVLMHMFEVMDGILGKSVTKLQEIDAKAKSSSVHAV